MQPKEHCFSIELENKNYEFSFNVNENVSEAADRFLLTNKLSKTYKEEIIDFVNKNFKKDNSFDKYLDIDINGLKKVVGDSEIIYLLEKNS